MVYPVATLPVSEVLSLFYVHLMMLGFATAVFVVSGLLGGFGLSIYFVQIVYYVFCTLAFAVVAATLLSALSAISRDIEHMVKSTITMLFWLTPILWPMDRIEAPLRHIIMLNPVCYLVTGYRNAFLSTHWFFEQWQYTAYFWGFMLVFTLISSYWFARLQREFADVL
jgi:teichoic acid transport system permease protein